MTTSDSSSRTEYKLLHMATGGVKNYNVLLYVIVLYHAMYCIVKVVIYRCIRDKMDTIMYFLLYCISDIVK